MQIKESVGFGEELAIRVGPRGGQIAFVTPIHRFAKLFSWSQE